MNGQGNLAELGFNAETEQPTSNVIPAGWYDVIIVNSEVKTTSAGDGKYIELDLQVCTPGPAMNRHVFARLNIWNKNEVAVQIARGSLSAICRAVGVLTPRDTSDLHGKKLRARVVVKKSDEYGDGNDVKAYQALNAGPSATPPAPAFAPPPAPAPAANPFGTVDPPAPYRVPADASEPPF
jgi:hypothetical protein